MSIFLAGAGPDRVAFPDIFDRFALDVRAHAGHGKAARIAVAVHHDGPNLQDLVAAYAEPLKARIDCGIAVVPLAATVRRMVAMGAPYLGFSAGAMVAPKRALVGGYLINGVEVCGEECSEGLASVDIREGLGLAAFTVDVHAAQAGTLSRAVGAVTAGLVERVVAIDEHTALVLDAAGSQDYEVIGNGNCWDVRQTGQAAVVSVRTAR